MQTHYSENSELDLLHDLFSSDSPGVDFNAEARWDEEFDDSEDEEEYEAYGRPRPWIPATGKREGTTLTASQKSAHETLKRMLYLKVYQPQTAKTVRLSSPALLAGPSGTGKSEAVRHFAQSLKFPLFSISVMNWTVNGAKAEPPTGRLLNQFLSQNDFGIIFLDEINKLRQEHLENPEKAAVQAARAHQRKYRKCP